MKTKSLFKTLSIISRTTLVLSCLLALLAHGALGASSVELLEKGIYNEETKGDLEKAVALYQQIVDDRNAARGLVAQAQLRLGLCHLKLGNKSKAVAALERLTQDFPDKEKLLGMVEKQMPLLLDEIVTQIEQNYVKELDRSELMTTAIKAIIGKLDQQSDFLSEEDLAQVNRQLDQKVAGVGARLKFDKESGQVLVETPLPGSPAAKGGLRPGDRIIEIDGQPAGGFPAGKELEAVVKLIHGPVGEPITLGIRHPGSEEVLQLKLVRDVVRLPSVLGVSYNAEQAWEFMLDEQRKVAYIRLTAIGRQSPAEMGAALDELTARGMQGLVLDLRNNPGGLLDQAVAICNLFVESGTIVTVKGRTGKEQIFSAKDEGVFSGFPMALLVNSNTASASEIIAACLQDHHRAVVIGERTFGQGLVKSLIQLEGGKSALKLPTSAYYRPSGKNMHRYPESKDSDDWGVRPDPNYEVIFSEEEKKGREKCWREREILEEPSRTAFHDRQMQKALEFLLERLEKK